MALEAARRRRPRRARRWSRARRAASARPRSRCSRRRDGASSPRPAARARPTISKASARPRSSTGRRLSAPGKPLGKERWAAAVDSVGSTTLANVLAQTRYGGAVAACGLAGGMDLPASVAPFILRGVKLLGIDSVNCPMPPRLAAWARLARDLDRARLAKMTQTIPFDRVFEAGADILAGKVRGRDRRRDRLKQRRLGRRRPCERGRALRVGAEAVGTGA